MTTETTIALTPGPKMPDPLSDPPETPDAKPPKPVVTLSPENAKHRALQRETDLLARQVSRLTPGRTPIITTDNGKPQITGFEKGTFTAKRKQYVGRNESCPCGSGAKWKRCHGGAA